MISATFGRGDALAVAEDRDPVAIVEDLDHAVRDVDDRDAARGELAHDAEQHLRLALGERGGRLVEDQHAAVERQRLGDLDQLLLGDRKRADEDGRVDGAELRQRLAGPRRRGPDSPSATSGCVLISAMKMFSATVTSGQSAISWWTKPMPSSWARAGEAISTGFAVEADLAAVGPEDAVDDVHQRRLAGAVLAGDGVHLAAPELEVDARAAPGSRRTTC